MVFLCENNMVGVTPKVMALSSNNSSRVALGLILLMISPILLGVSGAATPNDISIDGDPSDWPSSTDMGVDENGVSLSEVAKLDTMVTVVDAVNFLKDYEDAKYLQDTGESLGEDDERSVADLLVDQIEFADVILISKTDLVKADDITKLKAILKNLNTNARILPITMGKVEIEEVLDTGLFDFEKAKEAPGWLKEMRGDHIPETEEYGISSFSYEARRPFHPCLLYTSPSPRDS